MSYRWTNYLVLIGVFWLAGFSTQLSAQTGVPSDPNAAIAQARQLLSSLNNDVVTSRYAQVGREYGLIVDGVRKGKATIEQLTTMRDITKEFRNRTTARLKAAEAAAG